jgi:hypothetical protein
MLVNSGYVPDGRATELSDVVMSGRVTRPAVTYTAGGGRLDAAARPSRADPG